MCVMGSQRYWDGSKSKGYESVAGRERRQYTIPVCSLTVLLPHLFGTVPTTIHLLQHVNNITSFLSLCGGHQVGRIF